MSGADARARIVAQARVLDAAGAPAGLPVDLGVRARRLSRRLAERAGRGCAPAVDFADIGALPDWASWATERRDLFVHLAGAMACAPALRRTIDGRVLARLARQLGEATLDAVLATPAGLIPPSPCDTALASDAGLRDLGAAVLLSELADRPALSIRLAHLLDAQPWPLPPAVGQAALLAARGSLLALEAGAMEAAA
ncbi:hypothetical protein J2800_003289 [Caulobacter rhizosphaerae]|uniref:Uncharacterized protein n=1 Tax=Caulobacter rhizosphaerae TaxID=2010972 RepID=A0ABU1N3M6_9CAUL|nr:hypothetical protein [Caulobacter rhizosphaerae]MDR6532531.1 hypothetical protein [Caulobacter rhizosphaerae]